MTVMGHAHGTTAFVAPTMSARPRRTSAVLADATKGAVCAAAGVVCLYGGAPVAVALAGALGNAALAKILKRLLRVPRPEGSGKHDAGMPSSHAASLVYLARAAGRAVTGAGATALAAGAALACAWRVRCGYHTAAQVFAGSVQGVAVEAAWYAVVTPRVLSHLNKFDTTTQLAIVALVLVVVCIHASYVMIFGCSPAPRCTAPR